MQQRFEMTFGTKATGHASVKADTATLRYHLTSLYALRPIPDDMLRLVEQIEARVGGAASEGG